MVGLGIEMPDRINIGLIGCGRIMPAHLNGYMQLMAKGVDNFRITALAARKREDALRFRKHGEGPLPRVPVGPPGDPLVAPHVYVYDFQKDVDVEIYTDYKEMLKSGNIDAVDIYTSPFTHYPIVMDSLIAGKHVLVEKPLAITVKSARKMVEAADEAGKVLGVAENAHYAAETRMIRWALDQGYIGDVQMLIYVTIGGYWSPDKIVATTPWRHQKIYAGAGPTLDLGVHIFNIFRYILGEIDEVCSVVKMFEETRVTRDETGNVVEKILSDVDDTFVTLIKFKSNAVGQASFSWASHGEPIGAWPPPGGRTIYGSKGCIKGSTLVLDDGTRAEIKVLFDKDASADVKEKFFPLGLTDTFAIETLEFLRAIEEGREMETSGRGGLRDIGVCYSMIESSRLGRFVKVDDVESGKIGYYEKEINEHYGW